MAHLANQVGYTCAYAPLPLIDAAGFSPYRILPLSEAPDRAGALLHDNLCPHVKRVLDRGLAADLPELAGVLIVNSCDAMRRLADAWEASNLSPVARVDLPPSNGERFVPFFADELQRCAAVLEQWSGRPIDGAAIVASARRYRALREGLTKLSAQVAAGRFAGGRGAYQELLNRSVSQPIAETTAEVERLLALPSQTQGQPAPGVPVFVFGNVLGDPAALRLLEECGARVVGDDLCTGERQLTPLEVTDPACAFEQLARSLLRRPLCARTIADPDENALARQVAGGARATGASGVIAHLTKFCDPYLGRLPALRSFLEASGLPLLVLEGDCTLRSLGQHATRIEAFVEMLGDRP